MEVGGRVDEGKERESYKNVEGRIRKEAYKGDVASEVSSISKAAHSLPPPQWSV